MNGAEEDVDCGGACVACAIEENQGPVTEQPYAEEIAQILKEPLYQPPYFGYGLIGLLALGLLITAGIAVFVHTPADPVAELRVFIARAHAEGYSRAYVTDQLMKAGWPKEIVDKLFDEAQHT